MEFSHTDGIEASLMLAIEASRGNYSRKKAQFLKDYQYDIELSVTTLPVPVQAHQLKTRHWDKIIRDARQSYYSILGDLLHKIAEEYALPGDIVEERIGRVYNGNCNGKPVKILVHGASDRKNYTTGYIKDYKYTSMMSMNFEKTDYIQQLNLLRYLDPYKDKIKQLSNIFVFRDFRYSDAVIGRSSQPTFTKEVFYDVWSDEQCKEVLKTRVSQHLRGFHLPDDQLPECTKEELWMTRSGFRVRHKTKSGEWSKLSSGWAETEAEALELTKKKASEWRLEPTTGRPKRCEWCDARQMSDRSCAQWRAMTQQDQGPLDNAEDADIVGTEIVH